MSRIKSVCFPPVVCPAKKPGSERVLTHPIAPGSLDILSDRQPAKLSLYGPLRCGVRSSDERYSAGRSQTSACSGKALPPKGTLRDDHSGFSPAGSMNCDNPVNISLPVISVSSSSDIFFPEAPHWR